MDRKHYGMPGIGGSLGKCSICGETFLVEILLGKPVQKFQVSGIEQMLYAHDKCEKLVKKLIGSDGKLDLRKLPNDPLKLSIKEETNVNNSQ